MKSYKIEFEIIAKKGQYLANENASNALRELLRSFNNIKEAKFVNKSQK